MTVKQKKFVEAYVANNGNGTKAALEAYNVKNAKTASVVAAENLAKPSIKSELQRLMMKHELTVDNALIPIAKGLKAKRVISVEGDFFETEVDDLDLQLKASDRVLKLHGAYQNVSNSSNLHLHLHKKSEDFNL